MTERIQKLQSVVIKFYLEDKKTTKEIADLLHINLKSVIKILKVNNIEIRKGKKNLLGNCYGRLKVVKFFGFDKSKKTMWECKCKCGNIVNVRSGDLLMGKIKSCGCLLSETSKENIKISHKKYPKSYGFKGIGELTGGYISQIKSHAMMKNREYSLSNEYLWKLYLKQNKKCALTGMDIYFGKIEKGKKRNQTASLDRIDSTKGYIEGNVQWLHKDINNIKQDYTTDELLNYCKLIYEKHFVQNKNILSRTDAI